MTDPDVTRRAILVDDPTDPRIAAYRDIRERDVVGRQGRFVAEGKVVLATLARSRRFDIESVFVLRSRLAGLGPVLAALPPGVPVYVAQQQVFDLVAGFHVHRGVIAIGVRPQGADDPAGLIGAMPDPALVVAAIGIANHDNVGSIFRNAAAFDADAVLLDATSCDPLYRKAIRVSVGAALQVPFACGGTGGEVVAMLSGAGFTCLALSPQGSEDIASIMPGRRTALLLGSEGEGLPPDILGSCRTVRIAMSERFDSLNVAAASAIALHRFWRGGR